MRRKNLGFTLAEVLIVIGIIGVVAALTLPNLNHATGDKEAVTRLQKAYSILSEANDRAVAIYGPLSTWNYDTCRGNNFHYCWMKRIGEFLKIAKSCDEIVDSDSDDYSSCDLFEGGNFQEEGIVYQLPDGLTISANNEDESCTGGPWGLNETIKDICIYDIYVDINGPNKGKNEGGRDVFYFGVSDSLGIVTKKDHGCETQECEVAACMAHGPSNQEWGSSFTGNDCTFWALEYGNLDYLKADTSGKCNDSNIVLDGVTNTSCH